VAALIQQANSDPAKSALAAAAAAKAAAAKPAPAMPAPGPATAAPRQLGTPVPVPAAAKQVVSKSAAPAATGGYALQIGAFKSQAEAEMAWKNYKAKHAALLSGYSDNIQQADLGEKGTWYRLKVGGFADREVASALCDRLKADGGACIPGK
jgi:cell division protein FtsN